MTLEAPLRTRLAKLVAVLASDHDGEIVAAAHALRRTLTRAGLDLHAFAKAIRVGDGFTAIGELERARALDICERIAFALRRELPVFAGMNLLEAEQIIADILQREIEDIVDSTANATARDVLSDLATDLDLNIWL